jgi:general secretion pathway protein D
MKIHPSGARLGAVSLAVLVSVLMSGCAGMRYHNEGMKLISEGQPEAGLDQLRQARELEPTNGEFRMDLIKATSAYANSVAQQGDAAQERSQLAEARALYTKALKIEPSNARARRGLTIIDNNARSDRLVQEAERLVALERLDLARAKLSNALGENPSHEAARRQLALLDELEQKRQEEQAEKAAARSVMNKPVTLQFRDANLRMVFEALSRTTGLNVILDRDVRADLKTTIFVKDAAVEDTVDLILMQNQLEKRAVNANTIFIYPATAAKQKEYQELQVRSFQIGNADVKYLQTLLKTVLKVKDVSVDERSSTLVVRDTADAIAVVSKVIAAHDVPEPEIMLEVEVLEISHDRLTNLGVQFPDSITFSTPSPAGGLTVGALRALTGNNLLVNGQSLSINLKLQDTDANILASPRIRARNKEKARILIGDRVPIITNSVTPTASGGGVVTGSVQYQDVGLKLEFEPQVYNDEEVGIRIALEVSSIVKEITGPNGSLAYQIGTRNANTVVRLQDGETQILGGLISSGDRNTAAKVPGLGQLPVLGRLFSNNSGTDSKTEIVLSITPHILRAPAVLNASVRDVFSGTEGSLRQRALQLDPQSAASTQAMSAGGPEAPRAAAPGGSVPSLPLRARPTLPAANAPAQPAAAPATGPSTVVTPSGTITRLPPLNNNTRPGTEVVPVVRPAPNTPTPAPTAPAGTVTQ